MHLPVSPRRQALRSPALASPLCSHLFTVHCRRRKIRCLVAQDDAQGRCENCIRLRKECQYFPVDQQPAVEKKSRPNSRVGSVSTEQLTASLSPSTISGATDQREPFFPYQSIPLTSSQDIPGTGAGTFTGSSMGSFAPGWCRLNTCQLPY